MYPLGPKVAGYATIGTIVAAGAGAGVGEVCGLGPAAPVLSAAVIVIAFLASERARRIHRPLRFGPANRITLSRGILVGVVAAFIGSDVNSESMATVSIIAAVALAMDGLDGYVARRTGLASPYGAQLDMEVDSLLMMALSILAWQWDRGGVWVLFCGLARYLWVLACFTWPWFARALPPAFRRKTACVIGIGGLLGSVFPWPWALFATGLAATATLTLVWSFAIDVVWLVRRRHEDLP